MRVLELDHVFCMVDPEAGWAAALDRDGWALDAGNAHRGQGTRNRRLIWPEWYLELLWVVDVEEARANVLRLDRRAAWATTGASPFGLGLRGQLPATLADAFWRYEALGFPIWIHRDNEAAPERPLVFVLETGQSSRPPRRALPAHRRAESPQEIRLGGPARPQLPPLTGSPVRFVSGAHRLEIVLGPGPPRRITDLLSLAG